MGRSILAIVTGIVVTFVTHIGMDKILESQGVLPKSHFEANEPAAPAGEPTAQALTKPPLDGNEPRVPLTDQQAMLCFAYRTVLSIFAAWLTARMAPSNPMKHALILGEIGTGFGLLGAVLMWNENVGPHWYPIALALSAVPVSLLGGWIYCRQRAAAS